MASEVVDPTHYDSTSIAITANVNVFSSLVGVEPLMLYDTSWRGYETTVALVPSFYGFRLIRPYYSSRSRILYDTGISVRSGFARHQIVNSVTKPTSNV